MTNDTHNNYFLYADTERQEVTPWNPEEEDPEFFAVGNWQFDLQEDSDPALARAAALSWIAWTEFLERRAAAAAETPTD